MDLVEMYRKNVNRSEMTQNKNQCTTFVVNLRFHKDVEFLSHV